MAASWWHCGYRGPIVFFYNDCALFFLVGKGRNIWNICMEYKANIIHWMFSHIYRFEQLCTWKDQDLEIHLITFSILHMASIWHSVACLEVGQNIYNSGISASANTHEWTLTSWNGRSLFPINTMCLIHNLKCCISIWMTF